MTGRYGRVPDDYDELGRPLFYEPECSHTTPGGIRWGSVGHLTIRRCPDCDEILADETLGEVE